MRKWLFLLLIALGFQTPSSGQELPSRSVRLNMVLSGSLTVEQNQELTEWLPKMRKWNRYDARWFNKFPDENGVIGRIKLMPAIPVWLETYCTTYGSSGSSADLMEACQYLQAISLQPNIKQMIADLQAARSGHEKVKKTWFLSRLHIDGPSTQPQVGVRSGDNGRVYGLFGTHVTLFDVGHRVQMFGPPGILLMRVDDFTGPGRFHLSYTWGMSVRLWDFHFPGFDGNRNVTMHLTVMRCWLQGMTPVPGVHTTLDVMGVSFSPKKNN